MASHNTTIPPKRGLCCFPGLGAVGVRGGLGAVGVRGGRGEEALLLERQGRASQQTRSSSLPPPPSALPRPPRKPPAKSTRYDRLDSRDARKDSSGSGSITSLQSRGSPLPVYRPPSLPPSPRASLLRASPSPPRLPPAPPPPGHARRGSSASGERKGENNYRIQF